jgi:hypothetical protein
MNIYQQDDIRQIVFTELERFVEMKKIAEETDSQFMRAEAIGGIIACNEINQRLDAYLKSTK